ncbi:hypothetical protein M9Y10_025445 [Tritrichomonas musculus]|uniref:Uncharacterized protein n=1 Tax=Tritrichomonas musculus TaxID=1915356 RepID=A0ABR2H8Q4_9EUKA
MKKKNICISISQILNAPNNPYYKDSRVLRVIISPPDQNQYANLIGLETLTTGQKFNFQYTESNSFLTFVLMESKPNYFDIAYITISLANFNTNSFVQESQIMKATVQGINNPSIIFNIQITPVRVELKKSSSQSLYLSPKADNPKNRSQEPFVPNNLDFSAIIKYQQQPESQIDSKFLEQENFEFYDEDAYFSSDEEEEDKVINARIFFNDDIITLPVSSQSSSESLKPKIQQQQQHEQQVNRPYTSPPNKKPPFIIDTNSADLSQNGSNSIPFVPPDDNDAPFLLPKPLPSEVQNQNNKQKSQQNQQLQPKRKLSQQSFSSLSLSKNKYIPQKQQYPQQQQKPYQQQYLPQHIPQVNYPQLPSHDLILPPKNAGYNCKSNNTLSNSQINHSGSNDSNSHSYQIQQPQRFQSQTQNKYQSDFQHNSQNPSNHF